MPDNTQEMLDIDDIFVPIISDELKTNRRINVRYERSDIKASLTNVIFCFSCAPLHIQLLDLSTKGALISSDRKFRNNKKITIILEFEDSRTFEIKARIIRNNASKSNTYGVKFDKYNDVLGDYIFKTQTNLVFK